MTGLSFRARVFLLVVMVALTTGAATAWLTVQQTSEQLARDTSIALKDVDRIISELTASALLRGTWEGIAPLVHDLATRTGQRIRLTTINGTALADSATSPASSSVPARQTATIDTHRPPAFTDVLPGQRAQSAAFALQRYRTTLARARCWQEHGATVGVARDTAGTYAFVQEQQPPLSVAECDVGPTSTDADTAPVEQRFTAACGPAPGIACLQQVFADEIAAVTPPPALVLIGAIDQPPAVRLELVPALSAAALVAVLVVVVSLLISGRVVRPIGALATAAGRLGRGDLTERVPEHGRDELARLTRSFNDMAESLQHSKEQQHNMIADIAHELRTPLTNIRGYLEALKDEVFPPNPELFRSLYEEAMLQHRLLDDLQDLALAESGSLPYHRTPADLADLVRTCRTAHAPAAVAAGVQLSAQVSGPVPATVDQDRLRQVIGNLVTNALRATPAGGRVVVRTRAERDCAVIEVADTGSGISAEDLPHVFDRFWRADTARGRATGGRGLGLAIAREIVTAHDGTISVTSTVGTGTKFTVRLPLTNPASVHTGGKPGLS